MTGVTLQQYAFDNDSSHAGNHHDALAGLLDEFTADRIGNLLDLAGKRCLDVAAGGGGIAYWLAERVGAGGEVVATDIKPQLIPRHPRLVSIAHDIVAEPVPGTFDLIHARLLLNHLPQRREVLGKLAGALKPGGVLLTEDFCNVPVTDIVAVAPGPEQAAMINRYHEKHMDVLTNHRNDRSWAKRAFAAMTEEGLTDVETVVHARSWPGGSPGCRLLAAGLSQLRDELLEAGLTEAELERTRELFHDPLLVLHGFPLYSTSGRRAEPGR